MTDRDAGSPLLNRPSRTFAEAEADGSVARLADWRTRERHRAMWRASAKAEGIDWPQDLAAREAETAGEHIVPIAKGQVGRILENEGFRWCPHAAIPTACMCEPGQCADQKLFYQKDIAPPFVVGDQAYLMTSGREVTITAIEPLAVNDGTAERQRMYRVHWEAWRAERALGKFRGHTDWPREGVVPVGGER